MGVKLSELENGSNIVLHISNVNDSSQTMDMNASILKVIKSNIALISLGFDSEKKLVFDNVQIDMEHIYEDRMPILWRNVKIVAYKSNYVMQVPTDGVRHNRRNCYRVGVSSLARVHAMGKGMKQVFVRDISLTGFSITDRKNDLNLSLGDELSTHFEDLGHRLDLEGRVVRIEKHEDKTIYGLEIKNLCKELSSYISTKQRPKR